MDMDADKLADVIEDVFEDYVKDLTDLNNLDSQDLSENIALRVLHVLGLQEAGQPKRDKKAPAANPSSVSRALGLYEDEDGPLGKSQVRQTKYGPVETGGYRVSRGADPGTVSVRWVAPDDMLERDVDIYRKLFYAMYTKILRNYGYTVVRNSYGLSVSRTA